MRNYSASTIRDWSDVLSDFLSDIVFDATLSTNDTNPSFTDIVNAVSETFPSRLVEALSHAESKGLIDGLPGNIDTTALTGNAYTQTNLVANKAEYAPLILDETFVNAWGIAIRPAGFGGHFWITGNGSGISYEYVGDVNGIPLYQDDLAIVTVPGPNGEQGTPTGVVFNASSNFVITQDNPNGAIINASKFLFATDNGVISAWTERKNADGSFDRPGEALAVIDRSATGSQYFGLGVDYAGEHLYAADFGTSPKIQVFDGSFNDVTDAHGFANPFASACEVQPGDYVPFNVQVLGNPGSESVFVTYAKSQEDPNAPGQFFAGEEEAGSGLGRLAEFDLEGSLIRVWDDEGLLNAPWGVVYTPADFGAFSNTLLVSNFGDGTITAFDKTTYHAIDYLRDASGSAIEIPGIWGLLFGNGASLGDSNSLYFAAGPEDEADGVFGRLNVAPTNTTPNSSGLFRSQFDQELMATGLERLIGFSAGNSLVGSTFGGNELR
ncbi:TIGR03118 family protein [Leptolyngbyaceae cyanobacterium UHCC 1019]